VIEINQVPNYVAGAPSDCKMPAVPVQENSPISDTALISKSRIYGEDGVCSDYKKVVPSIVYSSTFSAPPISKGVLAEEVQYHMSQIDISSEKESWTRKRKQISQLTSSKHLQIYIHKEASSFLKLQYTVATSRHKVDNQA
jgi:hypothetical protein